MPKPSIKRFLNAQELEIGEMFASPSWLTVLMSVMGVPKYKMLGAMTIDLSTGLSTGSSLSTSQNKLFRRASKHFQNFWF